MAHPGKGQCTPGSRYGGRNSTPCFWVSTPTPETPRYDRVSVPRTFLDHLYPVHPLMVSPSMAPETMWHMMHAKTDSMGMTQRVAPLLNWLRSATVDPQQGISALTIVDLTDTTMAQRQGTRTSLVPLSLPPQPPRKVLPIQQTFHMQAPAPLPDPTSQALRPTER